MNWYDNYSDLASFTGWLNSHAYFTDVDTLVYLIEKPWKWSREYELFQLWNGLDSGELTKRERVIEALDENSTTYQCLLVEWAENALAEQF